MRPLEEFPAQDRSRVRVVLSDIDDTLTTDGRLTSDAYAAMEQLSRSGLLVVPITGRPAGWCDHIARMWPVDAVVGENGAFYFRYDHNARRFSRAYHADAVERARNRQRLEQLGKEILAAVPGSALASDQHYREADLAIDYCEDVEPLPGRDVQRIVAMFEAAGATARVSSIHVNGWFGDYDKLTMTGRMLKECFSLDMDADKERIVFLGDSPNDAPMFGHFPNAIGVANISSFEGRLAAHPAYVTRARAGEGFVEAATALLSAENNS